MTDIKYVENELTNLRQQLEQSFSVLDQLAQVQRQFEDLARTYQVFKAQVGEAGTAIQQIKQQHTKLQQQCSDLERNSATRWADLRRELLALKDEAIQGDRSLNQGLTEQVLHLQQLEEQVEGLVHQSTQSRSDLAQSLVEARQALQAELQDALTNLDHRLQSQDVAQQRLAELERGLEMSWKQAREDLLKAQDELSTADRTLNLELVKQVNGLQREMDGRLSNLQQEWNEHKEALRAPMEEFEAQLRNELRAHLARIREAGLNPAYFDKMELLEGQLKATRQSHQILQTRVSSLKGQLFFVSLLALVALSLPIVLVITNPDTVQFPGLSELFNAPSN